MGIKRNIKNFLFNFKNSNKNITIEKDVYINKLTVLEGNNKIYNFSEIPNTYVGFGTYIARNSKLPNSLIGKYCSIGENVSLAIGRHPVEEFVSTHPAFFSIEKQAGFTYVNENKFIEHKFIEIDNEEKSLKIGNDVWIGRDVLIMEGIEIGDGAIIGAGSIVTKNIESYSICVGVPAKKIKNRFSDEHIRFLNEIKWWSKDAIWIKENASKFERVDDLYEFFKSQKRD